MDPAEYKHVVLGLLFLKYIEDAFEERRDELAFLVADRGSDYYIADPTEREEELDALHEERDEYTAENVFWVPGQARWTYLRGQATQPSIGKALDDAMDAIERDNPRLEGVLPKVYALPNLDKHALGKLRRKVERLLRKHGYPPDKQAAAVVTVIEQAEAVCREWGEAA